MLYILGGEDGDRELISMECYDIYSKTWTKQPDLTMVRKVSATGCGSWRLCKLTPKSVSLPGDGCCSGEAHTQGLTKCSSATQSPQHTSSLFSMLLNNAERIKAREF